MAWRQTKHLQQTSSCAVILSSRGVNCLSQTVLCELGQQLWNPVNSAKLSVICTMSCWNLCLSSHKVRQSRKFCQRKHKFISKFLQNQAPQYLTYCTCTLSWDHLDQVIRNYFMFPGLNSKIEVWSCFLTKIME